MRLSIEITNRHVLFLAVIVSAVSAIGIATGQTPSPGHSPSEIGPGEFTGGGNYIFPSSSNLNIQGNLVMGGIIENLKIDCPSGFTSIESQGRQLGCMQDVHQGTNTWHAAVIDCFTNYGGRLPLSEEWYISMLNANLQGETDGWEWVADPHGGNHDVIGENSYDDNNDRADTNSIDYRCFIPT